MADYTNSKGVGGKVFPENAVETEYGRCEPIITPQQLRNRHLLGLALESAMKDPLTGKKIVITDDQIKDIIDGAVQQVEIACHIDISPVRRTEKHPFDRNLYESFGYFKTGHRPVASIDHITVMPANGIAVYELPLDWVETNYAVRGQINIIPQTAAFIQGGYIPSGTSGGAFFLNIMYNKSWVPAYWQIEYTSGFAGGNVPRVLNELIGTVAAMEILSMLAATYARSQSHSLGIDGVSQSVSTPGPQIFRNRYEELDAKRKELAKRVKNLFGQGIFSATL